MIADIIRAVDAAALASDQSCDLGNGYMLQLDVEQDCDASINDYDCYGKVEWAPYHGRRPDGFDGSAEVLDRERGRRLWWLPYREGRKVYNDPASRRNVADIIEWGFQLVSVKLRGPAFSALGAHTVALASTCIGGIDPGLDSLASVLPELLADLADQVETEWKEGQP